MAGKNDEMLNDMKVSTLRQRQQNNIARSDKPVAYVTNNKRLFEVLYYWS